MSDPKVEVTQEDIDLGQAFDPNSTFPVRSKNCPVIRAARRVHPSLTSLGAGMVIYTVDENVWIVPVPENIAKYMLKADRNFGLRMAQAEKNEALLKTPSFLINREPPEPIIFDNFPAPPWETTADAAT